jgi:hypothetical protein
MHLGITDQVRRAVQKQNRLASIVGAVLGGFVPLATYTIAHAGPDLHTWLGLSSLALIAGGLAYSATTVLGWAWIAFRSVPKAIGFVVLTEGTMIFGPAWLGFCALGILVLINALATACNLAEDQKEARKIVRSSRPLPVGVRPFKALEPVRVGQLVTVPATRKAPVRKTSKRKAARS